MASLYQRWIPPQAAVKSQVSKAVTATQTGFSPSTEDPLNEDSPNEDSPTEDSTPKPKKTKKRKHKQDADDAVQLNEATPKKHKKILDKFERSSKRAPETIESTPNEETTEDLHDLVPIPQPEPIADTPFVQSFSTLPSWLTKPVTVESSKTVPFKELGVKPAFLRKLEEQGFSDALAVQVALLPMMHPGSDQHIGDLCVSAQTGSGKTLAYLLPIVEALSDRVATSLSAIVVVPTRQLVEQAFRVAENLCPRTKVKVGTASGNVPFAAEQKRLVKRTPKYDPKRAKELHKRANEEWETGLMEKDGFMEDLLEMPKDHIPCYESGVDILICTPGRLVEHIESTIGFLLRDVKWLVIDEADQLLNQEFQGWASNLINALHGETPEDLMNVQERLSKLKLNSRWHIRPAAHRQVKKIILSATLKKDLSMLGNLKLKQPKLVVVEDDDDSTQKEAVNDRDTYELPSTLDEYAVAVGDGSDKPLFLLHVLLRNVFANTRPSRSQERLSTPGDSSSDDSSSASSSSEESDSESSSSETSVELDESNDVLAQSSHRVLIFTKSNENASRLSHLLSSLHPPLKEHTKTLTRSSSSKSSKKILDAFGKGKIKVLISSDLASRGLDIADLTHVINYDIPSSTTSYVHRVGRTARAGKSGQAWTLFTKTEAAWFWKAIAKGSTVKRGDKKVHRVTVYRDDVVEPHSQAYQEALQELQGAVEGVK